MAKFSEIKENVVIAALSGAVPFVRGLHGIGKSEMMESVAEELGEKYGKDVVFHAVDMAHIKEGELTGMPVTGKDPETGNMINTYTTYSLFNDVIKESKAGMIPVIFFDEINRADRVVFNELMPIILSKRVQETYLPENTVILAAGNPEDITKYKGATDDYSVLPMDPALKDRFFIFELDVDPVEWLSWAIDSKKVHSDIIEFITEHPEMLHFLSNKEINPTPRGWKMFSDAYTIALKDNKDNYDAAEDQIIMLGKAKIGLDTVLNFSRFLRENKNPMLKVTDFFGSDVNDEKFQRSLSKLSSEPPTRQFVTMKNITDWVIDKVDPSSKESESDTQKKKKELSKDEAKNLIKKYSELLWVLPKDIMLGTIKEIMTVSKKTLIKIVECNPKKVIDIQKYVS